MQVCKEKKELKDRQAELESENANLQDKNEKLELRIRQLLEKEQAL